MNTQTDGTTSEDIQHYKVPFSLRRFVRTNSAQLGILGVFLALWLIFIISAPNTFLSPQIYSAFMSSIPFFAIMSIPLTIVIIAAEIDLSFPSIMAMGMVAFSFVYNTTAFIGNPTIQVFLAIVAALLTGTIIGWLNGFIIVKFGIPSLVVTIGTQFLWRGATLVLTQGANFTLSYITQTFFYPLLVGKIGILTYADGLVGYDHDPWLGAAKPSSIWRTHLPDWRQYQKRRTDGGQYWTSPYPGFHADRPNLSLCRRDRQFLRGLFLAQLG